MTARWPSGAGARKAPVLVVKVGGEVLGSTEALASLAGDIAVACTRNWRVVVVHGGGPQTTEMTRRLGLEPRIVGGRRITDRATLDVVKMVLAGLVSVDLAATFRSAGIAAVSISGVSDRIIDAVKRPPRVVPGSDGKPVDFGWVGDIVSVGTNVLDCLLDAGYVPLLNPLGADSAGEVYNINADVAAARVAAALGARDLVLCTGVPGVLRDVGDPASRIARLSVAEAEALLDDPSVSGGMLPKIQEGLEALRRGVQRVHITSALPAGNILREVEIPGSAGTVIERAGTG